MGIDSLSRDCVEEMERLQRRHLLHRQRQRRRRRCHRCFPCCCCDAAPDVLADVEDDWLETLISESSVEGKVDFVVVVVAEAEAVSVAVVPRVL